MSSVPMNRQLMRTTSWPAQQCLANCFVPIARTNKIKPARTSLQAYAQNSAHPVHVPSRAFSSRLPPVGPSRPARKQVVAKASWGAPVEFSTAKIVSNKVAAPGIHQILVDVGTKLASGYTTPGQYVQAKTTPEGKAGFFAIASGPDPNNQGVLELLIKIQPGATAEALCALQPGAEVLVSPAQGKGFPVSRIPAADFPTVLMFATGSGISPIKAVIESGVLEVAKRKDVRLYYGTKSPEATAYQALVPEWEKQGIKVVQVHSGDAKKYVQGVFAEDVQHLSSPSTVGVLLCGQKDMCNTVTELCKNKGVEQIMMNF